MTVTSVAVPRSIAFGSIDDGIWGVAWLTPEQESGAIALGTPERTGIVEAAVEGHDSEEEWRMVGDGVDLMLTPVGTASQHPEDGFNQLGRVQGRFALDGKEYPVQCLGWRAAMSQQASGTRLGSFRQVAAWFEPGEGLALLALRPQSARGQEADQLMAAVLDLQDSIAVADPRLSTTYTGDGRPSRAGLELWIGDEEEEYPRRASGEAVGQPVAWGVERLELLAQLFSWHSRGSEGAGVYVMGLVR